MLASIALIGFTLLTHAVILLTPGFFSADEWQKFDHIATNGFWHFVQTYGALRTGPEFGYPVRPIGFLQQGIAALWMQSAPWASHLVGVLNHAVVALAFVWVLRGAGLASGTAALAGVFFVLSPLTTMSTGWIAASFDQLYVLFLLVGARVIVRLPADGLSLRRATCLVLATVAALLSKETAIVAPGGVLLLACLSRAVDPQRFSWRPYLAALVLVLIPLTAYLLIRAPSISNTIAGNPTPLYAPDVANVPASALRFFAFPFRLRLVEMSDAVFRSPWQPAAASLAHFVLIVAVWRLFGLAFAFAYVAGYFLFLLPVLALPNPGSHYLYGAGLAMSLAMAAVFARLMIERRAALAAIVVVAAAGLFAHDLKIQTLLYDQGRCQSRVLADVDRLLLRNAAIGVTAIRIAPEAGAPLRVAVRATSYRERYTANGVPLVTFEHTDIANPIPTGAGVLHVHMTAACTLVADPVKRE